MTDICIIASPVTTGVLISDFKASNATHTFSFEAIMCKTMPHMCTTQQKRANSFLLYFFYAP